jgi:ABC-2 type transport system permease protein
VSAKLWAIVKREYVERVRTKAFVIGTILGPIVMAALMVVPMLAARTKGKALRVSVIDATTELASDVEQALRGVREGDRPRFDVRPGGTDASDGALKALNQAVNGEELDGYLVLPRDVLKSGSMTYYGRNVSNFGDLEKLKSTVGRVLVSRRLTEAGLDPTKVEDLTRETELRRYRVSATGQREDQGATFLLALILLMILYVSILMWGQMIMTSVIEEKTSRVVEVMASGVPSTTLLLGKLLGVGAAGLTQFLVWVLSLLGMSLASGGAIAIGSFVMPEITPLLLGSFVAYFLLGYFFYSALYAAIGAAVNTVQEAQGLVFPVLLPLILAMVCWPAVIQSPDGPFAVTVSMIPGMSPLVMFLRIVVLTPPVWQMLLSAALALAGILAVVWIAARVYRVGILMYGKRPTFPEIVRWVRHS